MSDQTLSELSLSLNSCVIWFVVQSWYQYGSFLRGKLGVFVLVAQGVNCGICWVFLKVCTNTIRPINPEILCKVLITHHIHSPYHFTLTVQQFLVTKRTVAVPNCMWLLSVTATQQLTPFIVSLQYVELNRKQQQVQKPSQIGIQRFFNHTAVASACVCEREWLRFCIYQAMYRLCPGYRKSFIPPSFLCTRK